MARRSPTWRCRACLSVNGSRKRKCGACGRAKPARRVPKHMAALELPYEAYAELNGGELCGICKTPGSGRRRLDRDHDHRRGIPRGLLHPRCNRSLPNWVTPEWLRAAAEYLERTS